MKKSFWLYALALALFGLGIVLALQHGRTLPPPSPLAGKSLPAAAKPASSGVDPSASLLANLRENSQDPLTRLLLQVILIIVVSRICGTLVVRFGQTAVIGEMIAGILLGPSLFGWLWPEAFQFFFPPASLGTLRLLSQIGVCLFMFVVGMELDLQHLKQHAHTAVVVSQVAILFPYLLGVTASLFLYSQLAGAGTTFIAFALFIGISLSITAFPVLARILDERRMTKTSLGTTAIACAAVGDVSAWSVLAAVVAIVKAGSVSSSLLSIALVVTFVLLMLFVVKPLLARWLDHANVQGGTPDKGTMAAVLVFVFACSLATDILGIHALFGAFLAGVVMPPHGEFRDFLKIRLEHFSSAALLPLFFAFTGLRTQIGLLNDAGGLLLCVGLIGLATIGKLGGTMVTARFTGMSWIDSFSLGALMNTRGLIELIALNIGYDLGILSPRIFVMLVLMAIVTTCLTCPLLSFGDYLRSRKMVPREGVAPTTSPF